MSPLQVVKKINMNSKTIFFSISQLKTMTAQHLLNEADIESHVINKLDTAHAGVFGDIELHVDESDAQRAEEILIKAEIL